MSHDGQPKWSKEHIDDMRRALTAEYGPERGLTESRKGLGGGAIGVEPESEARRVAEIERAAVEMEREHIESLRAQLAEKERECRELSDAWDDMRDAVLHGIDHFDNDQTNAVLSVIDDHDPRALENDDG